MGSNFCSLYHMHWMPYTCNKNLRTEFIIFKYLVHLSNKVHPILSIVI